MKNISFSLTTEAVLKQQKTVTRRMGWDFLKAGDLLCGVKKGMGLRRGEKVERIALIEVVRADKVPLRDMTKEECYLEGFPHLSPAEFITMFCQSHRECHPGSYVTRIEFTYVDLAPWVENQTATIGAKIEEALRRGIGRKR